MSKGSRSNLLASLMAAAAPAAVPAAAVGAPVRNRQKAPSVERQAGRGVRTLSLSLFPAQRTKLQELTAFLFENDLRRSASLTVRTCFQVAKLGPEMLPVAQAVAGGTDYEKRNIAVYDDEQVILKNMTRYFVKNGLDFAEAVCARVVIEMAAPDQRFLEVARDLEERQDQRGKKVSS
jgi:hypothetical protein